MNIERTSRYGWGRLVGLVWLLFAFGCAGGATGEARSILEPPYEAVGGSVWAVELLPMVERDGRVLVTDAGAAHDAVNRTVVVSPPKAAATGPDAGDVEVPAEMPGELPGEQAEGQPGAGADTSRGIWQMSVGGWWVVEVTTRENGAVVILNEVEEAEARRVEYNPPLPMLPAELWMNRPIKHSSRVGVYNHETGVLESTGEVTATYRLLGKKILSPRGILPGDAPEEVAYIVRVDRRYNLPLVVIDMKITTAYIPGEGPIAARTIRVIKLLGLIPIMHEQSVERVK